MACHLLGTWTNAALLTIETQATKFEEVCIKLRHAHLKKMYSRICRLRNTCHFVHALTVLVMIVADETETMNYKTV